MKYREIIKKVQLKSGFSDAEAKDALELMVEAIAVRLNEGERKDFASQLPEELQDLAMSVYPSEGNIRIDLLQQFMDIHGVSESHAKKQIKSTWEVIEEAITKGEIDDIKSQLPDKTVAALH